MELTVVMEWMLTRGDYSFEILKRFVTYPFVQLSFTGALFGIVYMVVMVAAVSGVRCCQTCATSAK